MYAILSASAQIVMLILWFTVIPTVSAWVIFLPSIAFLVTNLVMAIAVFVALYLMFNRGP